VDAGDNVFQEKKHRSKVLPIVFSAPFSSLQTFSKWTTDEAEVVVEQGAMALATSVVEYVLIQLLAHLW
jgi:hypothetical protein